MRRSLDDARTASIRTGLAAANADFARAYPGSGGERQPVHTVYGGAQIFKSDSAPKMGSIALRNLSTFAPDAGTLASALGEQSATDLFDVVYDRVVAKLEREPVEDFRIDFEDGFGNRPDDEEDREAVRAAGEVAKGMDAGTLPPFIGIRIKPFTADLHSRAIRTLDLFVTSLVGETSGRLPENFAVTLPKVSV
ncbi:MAG: phosphoenolpyruvate kinase, partial [Rhodothermales bacterium]|nr:phosphoenolpyruvate kinase [Rhodothermales bacterium]